MSAACFVTMGQTAPPKASPLDKGLAARTAPTDYQVHAEKGGYTLGMDFVGHSMPTLDGGVLSNDDYIALEVAVYGPAGTRAKLAITDFKLRINNKKNDVDPQPAGMLDSALKDPEWEAENTPSKEKSKSGMSSEADETGVKRDPMASSTPVTPKPSVPVKRSWIARLQKMAFIEGDRELPQGGLIFFPYHGKTAGIKTLELVYKSPGGEIVIKLKPE